MQRAENLNRDEDRRDAELPKYGRLMQQSTNDAGSMKSGVDTLTYGCLAPIRRVQMKDPGRSSLQRNDECYGNEPERQYENCRRDLDGLDDLDGGHIVWHVAGAPTSLVNARAACITCNRSRPATDATSYLFRERPVVDCQSRRARLRAWIYLPNQPLTPYMTRSSASCAEERHACLTCLVGVVV